MHVEFVGLQQYQADYLLLIVNTSMSLVNMMIVWTYGVEKILNYPLGLVN